MRRAGAVRRINPRVAVLSLFGMMNWVHTWHRRETDPQTDSLADTMMGMFLYGVTDEKRQATELKPARIARNGIAVDERAAG
jgi:hypothetical protein